MVSSKAILAGLGALAVGLIQPCLAFPFSSDLAVAETTSNHDDGLFKRADKPGVYLRIMPLGASITAGDFSDNISKTGYRKLLRDKLRWEGWEVNMVGNFNSGKMNDNVSSHCHFAIGKT
ncbi:hypothetical protein IMZ48_23575 [Candidatus Bathyarchaeota archaeon]|nr:hypothetical protein [Candidatus Bathyarchaeota archaeon]